MSLEQEVLRLEREYWHLDGLKKRLSALEQGLAASWATAGFAAPPSTCIADFPNICPCAYPTITLNDSYYGNVDLTWDGVNSWKGCANVTLPNNASCAGPISFALHYTLTGDATTNVWNLTQSYKIVNFTTHCPVASVCADATNQSHAVTVTVQPYTSSSASFSCNGTVPGTQCYPSGTNVTLTVPPLCDCAACTDVTDFPSVYCCIPATLNLHDSQYGDTTITYDATNQWWTGCKVVSYVATTLCPAKNVALWYFLEGTNTSTNWTFRWSWVQTVPGAGGCPTTSTCASTENATRTGIVDVSTFPSPASGGLSGGLQGQIYPPSGGTVTISFP